MSDYQSDGIQKAAILLSSLPSETAGALIRRLDPAQAVKIRRELLKMRPVALDTARSVISEFIRKTEQRSSLTAAPTAATASKTGLREAQTQIQAPFPNTPADDIPVSGAELSGSDHPSKTAPPPGVFACAVSGSILPGSDEDFRLFCSGQAVAVSV